MNELLNYVVENKSTIFELTLAVHAVAVIVVNLTPTPADNIALGKVYRVVEVLGGIFTATAKK